MEAMIQSRLKARNFTKNKLLKLVNLTKICFLFAGINMTHIQKKAPKRHILWMMLQKTKGIEIQMLRLRCCLPPLLKFLATRLCTPLLVFDKTPVQLHFAVVNCSDAVMSVFYSPVLTRSLIFLNCCVVALCVCLPIS